MHFPAGGTSKTLLFFTVLTAWAIGSGVVAGDKTLNLRIGFDLTQGTNGAPALRIRDFEDSDKSDSQRHMRTEDKDQDDDADDKKPAIRADSFSDEDKSRQDSSREEEPQSSDGSGDEDGKNRHRSTKGLRPGEYEPEENPKIHGIFDDDDEDSGDADRRRRKKRGIMYDILKRKSKKFYSLRKQGVTRIQQSILY